MWSPCTVDTLLARLRTERERCGGICVTRDYYKEPDVVYGRPKTKIEREPKDFKSYDEEMRDWDPRRFMRELVKREGDHAWKTERREWDESPAFREAPLEGSPPSDPDEINAFLCRPSAISEVTTADDAAHALTLGMVLLAIDPNVPDLRVQLADVARKIRERYPPAVGLRRGRPSKIDNAPVSDSKVDEWREHRIVALHELRLAGHDLRKKRKQVACWMFPDITGEKSRAAKLDRAVLLLDDALALARVIDAQTR
jgi:hypothetical protein